MENPQDDRSGMLILRTWIQGSGPEVFRARITAMLDAASGERSVAVMRTPDEVYAVIRAWVESFVHPN